MPTMFFSNHADYLTLCVLVLYCYDWLITIDQEFQHIWFRRWSLSTWVFVMNRYATLLDCILDMLPVPNASVCGHMSIHEGFLSLVAAEVVKIVVSTLFPLT